MKDGMSVSLIWKSPLGFFQSLAIFASILLGATPAEAVNPVTARMRARISFATETGDRSR